MNDENVFTFSSVKEEARNAYIALIGLSNSGKTRSALLLARGLAGASGKVGLIDTETKRGKSHSKFIPGGYEYCELTPPFTPERYNSAIDAARRAGVRALVIDSASHEWEGEDGMLEFADGQRSQSGKALKGLNKFKTPVARHKKFMRKIMHMEGMYIICCLRAKKRYVQTKEEVVEKGLTFVQRWDFISDMTLVLEMQYDPDVEPGSPQDVRGTYRVLKYEDELAPALRKGERISVDTGARLKAIFEKGEAVDTAFETIRREGEEAAERGRDVFNAWWNRPDVKQLCDQLQPFKANYQSIIENAERSDEPEPGDFPGDAPMRSDLENPFGPAQPEAAE